MAVGFVKCHGYRIIQMMNWINSKFITDNKEIHIIDYAWRPVLRANYKAIREEYANYCNNYVPVRYSDIDYVQQAYDSGDKKWLVVILKEFGTYTKNIEFLCCFYINI